MKTVLFNTGFFNSGNTIFNIVMFFVAVIALCCSFYFYKRSQTIKKPTYIIKTINLIRNNIKKIKSVEILYDGKNIKNLSVSKIALWNAGKETIRTEDVAQKKPIKIMIDNKSLILDAAIVFQKNEANNFGLFISEDKKSINILFDYFDFKESIILQVFHTGHNSYNIYIDGSIKSVKKIYRKHFPNNRLNFIRIGTCLMSGSVMCMSPLMNVIYGIKLEKSENIVYSIIMGFILICIGVYWSIKKKFPKGFDAFNEEF
ncbi:MAG: hypothetical protein LBJ63_00725 [Prevotellaceae bacterium]|jgi:hypothetical protein|nr:hypothetical protein [Prevotellaceae bacterium]